MAQSAHLRLASTPRARGATDAPAWSVCPHLAAAAPRSSRLARRYAVPPPPRACLLSAALPCALPPRHEGGACASAAQPRVPPRRERFPPPHAAAAAAEGASPAAERPTWPLTVAVLAMSMCLCNVHRSLLSVCGLAVADELALSATHAAVLQSAYLVGYGAGQLPSGLLADRLGGPPTLLAGLALWSAATAALPLAGAAADPLPPLLAARALFGLASACALPATAATVAQLVPPARRASALSLVYGAFNVGSIIGLGSSGPLMAAAGGWRGAFLFHGLLGLGWAALGRALLPAAPRGGGGAAPAAGGARLRAGGARQLAALCWVHGVIGWGYFLLLSQIPLYLRSQLALTDMGQLGLLAALPWAVCAAVGVAAGGLADAAAAAGAPLRAVRAAAHAIATLGPAAALALLPLARSLPAALACLCFAMGAQALNYAGFHAHANAAGGARAGLLLAATNSVGIAAGIAANVATGALLERTGRFDIVFAVTAALYASSLLVWVAVVREGPIFE